MAEDTSGSDEDKIDAAEQAQAEQFDKAILTVSAALFGLSVGIFNVIQQPAIWVPCLVLSWVCICVSILATLLSFLTSQEALKLPKLDFVCPVWIGAYVFLFFCWSKYVK